MHTVYFPNRHRLEQASKQDILVQIYYFETGSSLENDTSERSPLHTITDSAPSSPAPVSACSATDLGPRGPSNTIENHGEIRLVRGLLDEIS